MLRLFPPPKHRLCGGLAHVARGHRLLFCLSTGSRGASTGDGSSAVGGASPVLRPGRLVMNEDVGF